MAGAPRPVNCAICGRSLLVGERAARFSPDGRQYVDVCPLCKERALEFGWYREGGASVPVATRARRRGILTRVFRGPEPPPEIALPEPVARRLSSEEQAMVQAAALFNASQHRRTIEGLMRSLGWPRASVVPLSGASREAVITVCWEISWYQYRVAFGTPQPVQLADRGYDPSELAATFTTWNAEVTEAGAIALPVGSDS